MSTDSEISAETHLAMARRVERELAALENLTVPTSTAYQEPTIVWHAAQHNLPYVHVGTAKVINPEIAEEPIQREERDERVVQVKSIDALFSRKPENKPLKAVRIVQLHLDSKQPLTKSIRLPAPARLEAQRSLLDPIFTHPASEIPLGGFIVVGSVNLFDVPGLNGTFEKWEGPAPSNVVVIPNQPISIERVTLSKDLHLPTVISDLKGSAFDTIAFRNVTFYHQSYQFDKTKVVGWHFIADLVIDESCGALRELLSTALGVDEPTLSVYLFLGTEGRWDKPPSLHSFTLEGVFPGLAVKPVDDVVLSKIAVRLFGIRTMKYEPTPRTVLDFGCSIYGNMSVNVPGSVLPLTLDYEIRESSGTVSLLASRDSWKNPLGVNGLVLSDVSFSTSFALSSPWKALTFDVSANLKHEDVPTTFQGTYSPRGTFELRAPIHNVTLEIINTLFRLISSDDLALPDVDLTFGTASLNLRSDHGFDIVFERVTIGDYTSLDAGLAITPNNATLRGKLTTDVVRFGDIDLKGPFLQVTFEKKGSSKTTDVIVEGTVEFSTLNFPAAVYLYKSLDLSANSLEWTVLAALTVGKDTLALSKVVPEVGGTPFDLALTRAVFVAASRDDPNLGNMITSGFVFYQGVQVCAAVGEIDALNSLMRGPVPGLTISAGWSAANGFDLQVYTPTPTLLSLGNGVTTTPFTLAIVINPNVELVLSAGLNISAAHSPEALVFTLSVGAGITSAVATGQKSGWWVNPLGVSPNVKVGPNLELSMSLLYATFVATGLPSEFAIQGGLMIGQTEAQLALSINEDPMKEFLSGQLESLTIKDLVDLASDIIDARIPDPPRDLFHFDKVQFYICPAGVYVGTTFYPQGFSFQSDAILFGKRINGVKCIVDANKVSIKGSIDNLALGPLTFRDATGPRANFNCELGPVDQRLLIDGVVSLFGQESPALIAVNLSPVPKFEWFTPLKFTDLLAFQLRATLVEPISFGDLSDADLVFDTLFEQQILQYIHNQILVQFDQARRAAKDGIEAAQKDVDKAEVSWREAIDRAQAALNEAKKNWDAKNEWVTTESNKIIDAYKKEIERLQNKIDSAQKDYDAVTTNAQNAVSAAERDRARALKSAQHDIDRAEREMISNINAAQRAVDITGRDLETAFGSAHAAIEQARRDLQSIQDEINSVYRTIREYENAPAIEFWKKLAIPGLYIAIGTLEASMAVADGALQAAQAVLMSADFLAKKAAYESAKAALVVVRHAGEAGIDVAKAALVSVEATSQAVLDIALAGLEVVKHGVEWAVLQGAKEALRVYLEAHGQAFRAATQALVDLARCADYIAYQTAQAALEFARASSITIDVARAAPEIARRAGADVLAVGQWVADHPLDAFGVLVVRLSGNLREMVGAGGSMVKPFTAHIEGVAAGRPFTLDGEFNLGSTADFISFIFEYLWDQVRNAM
ncbi:hypothetical protein BDV93DRAFT_482217 [Ceratobasidium sp. AG-I]|nr:hypothetical protein BDV93DRAFT_482217 [Ceratobasidium sp. AG-I]